MKQREISEINGKENLKLAAIARPESRKILKVRGLSENRETERNFRNT